MLHIPILRWGEPYKSSDIQSIVHFQTGEALAEVSQAVGGMVSRDAKYAARARQLLRDIPMPDLLARVKKAADLYLNAELPLGNGTQTADQFVRQQSATTGLPEHMCRFNMTKNHFVLSNMEKILDALTRGLDTNILARGYGKEARDVPISYQCQSPVLGLVLPSNSPGVHTLWLPIIPMQVGLLLKPGPQEPWTPYRMTAAFVAAGIPTQAIAIYPGGGEVGAAVLNSAGRCLIFGSSATVEQYKGNPAVQVHGPGFSKILLGDDVVDQWEKYLDLMVESVKINSGRGCINCSGIWASRHTKKIAEALAEKMGPIQVLPPDNPNAELAAFTVKPQAEGVNADIDNDLRSSGTQDLTAKFGARLLTMERCCYLRPTVLHCDSPEEPAVKKEYMFPFTTVVACPQAEMLAKIGPTLVCSAITEDRAWQRQLIDAVHIDRLNIGAIPTTRLNWLQPHEGNIVDFLFRARAFQWEGNLPG
jgi:acyl-CoA reductase-like NAD-dependent aldehyde dehydrogenase